jgi:hypothetical protein
MLFRFENGYLHRVSGVSIIRFSQCVRSEFVGHEWNVTQNFPSTYRPIDLSRRDPYYSRVFCSHRLKLKIGSGRTVMSWLNQKNSNTISGMFCIQTVTF